MAHNFYGTAEVAKLAEKIMRIGRKTGDFKFVDADEVDINVNSDYLYGVSTEWQLTDSPKFLMIKVDRAVAYNAGRIYVRKMTAEEKAGLGL